MAKFFETSDEFVDLIEEQFSKTGLDTLGINLKVVSITKAKDMLKVSRTSAVTNFLTQGETDILVTIYEQAFDRLPKDVQEMLVEMTLSNVSYDEMLEISSEGAKVLHNRCIEIGDKFNIPIITESTFNNKEGSIISDKIEENSVKSIVKKEISRISIIGNGVSRNIYLIKNILNIIDTEKLEILNFEVSESKISITFKNIVEDRILNIFHNEIFKEK